MKKWIMPEWMEPYRKCFNNTGGNTVEELLNDQTTPETNIVLYVLICCVRSQALLLTMLHERGLL